jgi:hypothetical protein
MSFLKKPRAWEFARPLAGGISRPKGYCPSPLVTYKDPGMHCYDDECNQRDETAYWACLAEHDKCSKDYLAYLDKELSLNLGDGRGQAAAA